MKKLIILITILSFALTSCNTIKSQRNQAVFISSQPEGAQIDVDGFYCGTTPNYVGLNPKYDHWITLEKEGYIPETYVIESKVSGKKLSNNLFFPVAGLAVGGIGAAVLVSGCAGGPVAGLCLVIVGVGATIGLLTGSAAGALGTGVDVCSGKARTLKQQVVHLNLEPAE